MRPRAVTIDLDGAWCYRRLHGDRRAQPGPRDPVLLAGTERFLDACARLDVKATLFVIGADLEVCGAFRDLITAAARAGHDVMSHSYAHAYDLAHFNDDDLRTDVVRARDVIAQVTGVVPVGFRAPGYTTSEAMWRALIAGGALWSSSVLPSPPYLWARSLVRLRAARSGTPSASMPGSVRAFSPLFARPPSPLVEHPISTAAGLPWLGTTLALLPDAAADALTTLALATTPAAALVFELHAADFVDGGLLPTRQPDRDVPLLDKSRRIERAMARAAGHAHSQHHGGAGHSTSLG